MKRISKISIICFYTLALFNCSSSKEQKKEIYIAADIHISPDGKFYMLQIVDQKKIVLLCF